MYSSDHPVQTIQATLNSKDNQICIDCGNEPTSYLIVDFSGFICENCYKIHKSLNLCQIIKPLESTLSEFEIELASIGGNTALFEFWEFYSLNYKPISYKYSTNASQHYKFMLSEIAASQESNSALLDHETGRQQSEAILSTLTSLIQEVELGKTEKKNAKKLKPTKTIICKIDENIQKIGDSIVSSRVYKEIENGMQSLSNDLNNFFK